MASRTYEFGPFLLTPDTRELRREGILVALPPKAFDTLRLLVERRDRAVTKQELLDALWPDVAVEESSLSQQVFLVRRALEQNGNGNRYIATVPRHGYRFVAEVREVDSREPQAAAPPPRPTSRRALLVASLVGSAALVAFAAWLPWTRLPPAAPTAAPHFLQVTFDPTVESFPSLSPDGSTVVYAVGPLDYRGESDIFVKNLSGHAAQNLTPGSPGADTQPAFSRDGQRIAFSSDRGGGTDGGIFVMGRMGDSVRPVTPFGYNPSWSPDGTRIVFSTENSGAEPVFRSAVTGQLWIADTRSGESKQIGVGLKPHWSPNGHRIAYLHEGRVWTMRADGTGARLLTESRPNWSPAWTPDGTRVYFCSARGGTMNVWRVGIDEMEGTPTGEPEAVTTPSTFVAHLSFSGDGRAFAFASVPAKLNIRHFELNPVAERVVREHPRVTSGSWATVYPDPSPDGHLIAFHSGHWREDIWVVRPDGSGLRQLTDDDASDRMARWSPDGRHLSFYSDRGGKWRAWLINADGSNLHPLTSGERRSLWLTWSPDGDNIRAVVTEPGVRAFVIDPAKPIAGQEIHLLPRAPGGKVFHATAWSPDGSKLAGRPEGARGVLVLSLSDKRFTSVTSFGAGAEWFADSRRLLVCDGSRFSIVDSVTGRVKEVLSLAPHLVCAAVAGGIGLSRDGRHLYAAPLEREGDVWVARFPDTSGD